LEYHNPGLSHNNIGLFVNKAGLLIDKAALCFQKKGFCYFTLTSSPNPLQRPMYKGFEARDPFPFSLTSPSLFEVPTLSVFREILSEKDANKVLFLGKLSGKRDFFCIFAKHLKMQGE
jgi:hypothetical protein